MDYKELIERLRTYSEDLEECGYAYTMGQAAEALTTLTEENAQLLDELEQEHNRYIETLGERDGLEAKTIILQKELEQVKRERDAAVKDIFRYASATCFICKHGKDKWLADGHMDDLCRTCIANEKCNWQWRGPQKEE